MHFLCDSENPELSWLVMWDSSLGIDNWFTLSGRWIFIATACACLFLWLWQQVTCADLLTPVDFGCVCLSFCQRSFAQTIRALRNAKYALCQVSRSGHAQMSLRLFSEAFQRRHGSRELEQIYVGDQVLDNAHAMNIQCVKYTFMLELDACTVKSHFYWNQPPFVSGEIPHLFTVETVTRSTPIKNTPRWYIWKSAYHKKRPSWVRLWVCFLQVFTLYLWSLFPLKQLS